MFDGGDQVRVNTSLSFDDFCDEVEDVLGQLGPVRVGKSGRFTVDRGRQSGTFTEVQYSGDVRERKGGGGYLVTLDYKVAPSTACLVVGIMGFFLCVVGCFVFLFPVLAKNEVERAARRALDEIEDELSR
jgi:cbb3-type cytochrome oxidase subunit 3